MDAEYQACGTATREALSLRKLLREVSMLCRVLWPGEVTVILCDNKAAVSLCLDRKETKRAKHIDIVHRFARDHVASGMSDLCIANLRIMCRTDLRRLCPGHYLRLG
jgi:hypothetical protein